MKSDEFPHLQYLSTKVGEVLMSLSVPNADRLYRLLWAYEELCTLPPVEVPLAITMQLEFIHRRMNDETKRRSKYGSLHYHCLRATSWKKRNAFAQEIVHVCVAIVRAAGEQSERGRKPSRTRILRLPRISQEAAAC